MSEQNKEGSVVLMSFKKCLEKGKAAIEEALIPVRVKRAKAQGEMKKLELDEQIIALESKIQELCVKDPIDYEEIANSIDEIELLKRRKVLFDRIIGDLFPENE